MDFSLRCNQDGLDFGVRIFGKSSAAHCALADPSVALSGVAKPEGYG